MVKASEKVRIAEKFDGSRTAHLQPLVDFLTAQGNPPWLGPSYQPKRENGFYFDRDGFGTFYFEQPLDLAALSAHFELPASIVLSETAVCDSRNFVSISQVISQGPPIRLDF